MAQWLGGMTALQQVFAYIAIAGTTALLIQTALMLFGIGHIGSDADGADASGLDHDHDGLDMHDHDFSDHDAHLDAHDHDHADHDHDHDHGLRPFTLRGFVALMSIMGWSGLAMLKSGMPPLVATLLALFMGALAMLLVAYAIRQMMRLQSDGSLNIQDATGALGSVYLPVPPERSGTGKVNVLIGDRLVELTAITDESTPLPYGARIIVACVLEDVALVESAPET